MHNSRVKLLLFLIGLGSQTQIQVVGSIGISELVMFLIGPFIFFLDYRQLKADGFMPFVWLSIFVCMGCVCSGMINHTNFGKIQKLFIARFYLELSDRIREHPAQKVPTVNQVAGQNHTDTRFIVRIQIIDFKAPVRRSDSFFGG